MFRHFLFLIACTCQLSSAQVIDDFNDSDLYSAPVWNGDVTYFTSQSILKSNSSIANALFYISTETEMQHRFEWQIEVQLLFNTSSLNYVDFVLIADSSNLKSFKNGYFVRLGGSSDEIALYKVINGVETKIIDGKDGVLNTSNNQYLIQVKYLDDTMYLMRTNLISKIQYLEGKTYINNQVTQTNAGFKIRQSTASFFGRHYFDNLYIGELLIDTVAPKIDSVKKIDERKLTLYFNEAVDTVLMKDTAKFSILPMMSHPQSIQVLNDGQVLILNFKYPLLKNQWHQLNCFYLTDKFNNTRKDSIRWLNIVTEEAQPKSIVITELMVDPEPVQGLPNREYVEIKNISQQYIQLNTLIISDPSSSKKLPDLILYPDSFCVLYDIPSLNNASDRIYIKNQNGIIIDEVDYLLSWYKDSVKSLGGFSLEIIDPEKICLKSENWAASKSKEGGTPGKTNSINTILPEDYEAPEIIEWYFQFPNKLILKLNQNYDSLSSTQLTIKINHQFTPYKVLYRNTAYIELVIEQQFNDTQSVEICISGFKDCSGNTSTMQCYTSKPIVIPKPNDIVINEILFNPKPGGVDMIEILNRSNKLIDASQLYLVDYHQTNTPDIFRISQLHLPIQPNQYCLISTDTYLICRWYYCGKDGLKIQMPNLPSLPDDAGSFGIININSEVIDSITYNKKWHFNLLEDDEGVSLERLNPNNFNNNSNNWHSAASIKGYATPANPNSQLIVPPKHEKYFTTNTRTLSPNNDGKNDVAVFDYELPDLDYLFSVRVFDINGRLCREIINNYTLGSKGQIVWDGLNNQGQKLVSGIYLVCFDGYHENAKQIQQIVTVVLYAEN